MPDMVANVLIGLGMIGCMALLTWLLHKGKISILLAGILLLGIVIVCRLLYMVNFETGPDASVWLASANTICSLPDSWWSLLTSNEARPLTVLPLVILHKLGMPLTYVAADITGIVMYGFAFLLAALLMKEYVAEVMAWVLILPLFAALATTSIIDYTSYNSEAPSLLTTMICLHLLLKQQKQQLSLWWAAMLGVLLGCLPFIKFQNVPAGLAIGISACLISIRAKAFPSILVMVLGSILPVVAVALFFHQRDMLDDFINDYFSNYFYYSYSQDYSADRFSQRFSPRRITSFIFRTHDSFWLLAGSSFTLLWITVKKKFQVASNASQWFALLLLLANFYAVIQSGWNSVHYLLYLWIPPLLYIATLIEDRVLSPKIAVFIFCIASVQIMHNQISKRTYNTQWMDEDAAIVSKIKMLTSPTESIVVWGYADRYYVGSQRPMGLRLTNYWWIVLKGKLQSKRIAETLYDLEKNKPALIVDNSAGPDPQRIQIRNTTLFGLPDITAYIQQHYQLIDSLHGAKFYLRKK